MKKVEDALRIEREKLVKELCLANFEREQEEHCHLEDVLQVTRNINEAKRLEELRVEEHERLLEVLRLARLAQIEEEQVREEE